MCRPSSGTSVIGPQAATCDSEGGCGGRIHRTHGKRWRSVLDRGLACPSQRPTRDKPSRCREIRTRPRIARLLMIRIECLHRSRPRRISRREWRRQSIDEGLEHAAQVDWAQFVPGFSRQRSFRPRPSSPTSRLDPWVSASRLTILAWGGKWPTGSSAATPD